MHMEQLAWRFSQTFHRLAFRLSTVVTFAGRVSFSWSLGSPRILLNTTPEGNNIFETLMNKSNRQNKLFPNFHPKWSFPPPPTWPSLLSLSVSAHFMHDSRPLYSLSTSVPKWAKFSAASGYITFHTERGTYQGSCKTVCMLWRHVNSRERKQLKGCIFSRPAPARGREARKCNPSIASLPTPLWYFCYSIQRRSLRSLMPRSMKLKLSCPLIKFQIVK